MNDTTNRDTPLDAPIEVEVARDEASMPPLPPPRPRAPQVQITESWSKSPALAGFLSLVPGLGHLYVGVYQRAAMLVIGFFAIIYLLPTPLDVFMCLFVWFFGIFDAYRQAQLANLGDDVLPVPGPHGQSGLMFGVFLTVLGAVLLINNFFPIDFDWLRDWWPALVVATGLYLIVSAALDRRRGANQDSSTETDTDFLE